MYNYIKKKPITNEKMLPVFQGLATICVPQMPPDNANIIECIDNSGKKKKVQQFK